MRSETAIRREVSVVNRRVSAIARAIARDAMSSGASAVVLSGSHVMGTATPLSDIDLIVIWKTRRSLDPIPSSLERSGHLVTVSATTASEVRADFLDPERFTTYVPGWRIARILADPTNIAARLQAAANRWSWDRVATDADAWVARQITGWAEEVHKLAAALDAGNDLHAATQRSLLAVQLAGVMAVRHRILSGSENVLWSLVSDHMGEPWSSMQSRALSRRGESLEISARAALELYAIAAVEAWPVLNRTQRAVVKHASSLVER
jgi:hypothetical protein